MSYYSSDDSEDLGSLMVSMNFLTRNPIYKKEKPYVLNFEPPEDFPKTNMILEKHKDLVLEDIRGHEDQLSLEKDGFQILKIRSKLAREDFNDTELVKKIYLQEVAEVVRTAFEAQKVQVLEHLLRKRHEIFPESTGEPYAYNQPASVVHVDTTDESTVEMVKRLHPTTSEYLLKSRFLYVNVWKPLRGPVRDWPLCFCHPNHVKKEDLRSCDLVYDDYVVENQQLHYAESQKWYWISDQTSEEAWIFIQSDSDTSKARVGVPHSSFALPPGPEQFPRESIEVRCLVYI